MLVPVNSINPLAVDNYCYFEASQEDKEVQNENGRRSWGDTDRQVAIAWNGVAVKRGGRSDGMS